MDFEKYLRFFDGWNNIPKLIDRHHLYHYWLTDSMYIIIDCQTWFYYLVLVLLVMALRFSIILLCIIMLILDEISSRKKKPSYSQDADTNRRWHPSLAQQWDSTLPAQPLTVPVSITVSPKTPQKNRKPIRRKKTHQKI